MLSPIRLTKRCSKCFTEAYYRDNFCKICGTKLPVITDRQALERYKLEIKALEFVIQGRKEG